MPQITDIHPDLTPRSHALEKNAGVPFPGTHVRAERLAKRVATLIVECLAAQQERRGGGAAERLKELDELLAEAADLRDSPPCIPLTQAIATVVNIPICGVTEDRPLHRACAMGATATVTRLLRIPEVDVNIRNLAGETPLHWAVLSESEHALEIVSDLLLAGAEVSLRDRWGDVAAQKPIRSPAATKIIRMLSAAALKSF